MFHENLRSLRKAKGYSQEELAAQLHVVRQTVSKWEKALSVPDADLLVKLADILETDVSTLLGTAIPAKEDETLLAQQLAAIAEQMAVRNRRAKRIWRIITIILLGLLLLNLLQFAGAFVLSATYSVESQSTLLSP